MERKVASEDLQFDIGEVVTAMENSEPTKRSVVSATAKFFDPLGIVSPVTILFKMFAQQLCEAKLSWDEPLTGNFLEKWNRLLQCVYSFTTYPALSARLIGFCDASAKAYAAIVYLRIDS